MLAARPATAPSTVLFGDNRGDNGRFPTARPTKYAKVSPAATTTTPRSTQCSPPGRRMVRGQADKNPPMYTTPRMETAADRSRSPGVPSAGRKWKTITATHTRVEERDTGNGSSAPETYARP